MSGLRTLVLNANYIPISIFPLHTIPAEDAVTRVFNGTCHVVEEYDRIIKTPNPKYQIKWPSVIARNKIAYREPIIALTKDCLYYRDHTVCAYCSEKVKLSKATIDHVLPKDLGGKHEWNNTVLSCPKCNHTKSNKFPKGRWSPSKKPFTPKYWDLVNSRKEFPINIGHKSWKLYLGDWKAPVIVLDNTRKVA